MQLVSAPRLRFIALAAACAAASYIACGQEVVADSWNEWSTTGTQGEHNWFYGYYTLSTDDDSIFQADEFIPFQNSCGPGGTPCPLGGAVTREGNNWQGPVPTSPAEPGDEPRWDLTGGYVPPWTRLGREALHPNGANSGDEHWVIRRWISDGAMDVHIRWSLRKQSPGGSGVTGRLFLTPSGGGASRELASAAIGGNNLEGIERVVETTVAEGDIVDFAVTPAGTDGISKSTGDGALAGMTVYAGHIDRDNDGVSDRTDNCPDTPNSNQRNSDSDSHGDACDNCPAVTNERQGDRDGDGTGNVCDEDFPGAERPNIVFIMLDDAGIGDFPVYVPSSPVATPTIDALAAGGMLFSQAYAGCTVCAPSRSVLMTGLHMGHTSVRGNFNTASLQDRDVTLAEVLKNAGYTSGGFGKWGLAAPGTIGVPERQGFDEYFGHYHQVHAHTHYCDRLYRNGETVILPENVGYHGPRTGLISASRTHSHFRIVEEMKQFISEKASKGEPFFAYGPWNPPHTNSTIPENDPAWDLYAEKPWTLRQKIQAAMITIADRQIGEVLDTLGDPDGDGDDSDSVLENTIVFFTSDNGGTGITAYSRNGPLRGGKTSLYEGGLRVPLIASWPGHIPAGAVSDHLTCYSDIMPTLAELSGADELIPLTTDGISLVPVLLDRGVQKEHEALYFEYYAGNPNATPVKALRKDTWKMILRPNGHVELFNLEKDTGERNNLASSNPGVVAQLRAIMDREHTPMRPQYNVSPPTAGNASKDGIVAFGIRPGADGRLWHVDTTGDAASFSGILRDADGSPVRMYLDDLDAAYTLGLELIKKSSSSPQLDVAVRGRSGTVYFTGSVDTGAVPQKTEVAVSVELAPRRTTPASSRVSSDRNNHLTLSISHNGGIGEVTVAVDYLTSDDSGERESLFVRGDCNTDGAVDISDAIALLSVLFSDAPPVSCGSACDANDDGALDIADPVAMLTHLFGGAGALPPPFAGCGIDTTSDTLECTDYPPCIQ